MKQRIKLPAPVAAIYRAVEELEAAYPLRKFTPDGHLVGSIGEVIAAEALSSMRTVEILLRSFGLPMTI
jgi:hypothetical protein